MSELREQIIMKQALPLHKKSNHSTNGAEYDSQGQARSASPLVLATIRDGGLKGRNIKRITPFQGSCRFLFWYQGRRASRLPLAIIFRAVGALIHVFATLPWLSYAAPLAL
jgi:hypothetical protein